VPACVQVALHVFPPAQRSQPLHVGTVVGLHAWHDTRGMSFRLELPGPAIELEGGSNSQCASSLVCKAGHGDGAASTATQLSKASSTEGTGRSERAEAHERCQADAGWAAPSLPGMQVPLSHEQATVHARSSLQPDAGSTDLAVAACWRARRRVHQQLLHQLRRACGSDPIARRAATLATLRCTAVGGALHVVAAAGDLSCREQHGSARGLLPSGTVAAVARMAAQMLG
jgi:hypothetical protein